MKRVILGILLSMILISSTFAINYTTADLPKKSIVIGQTMARELFPIIYIVDTESSELIIVAYNTSGKIDYIIKTGIVVDLNKQSSLNISNASK